MSLYVIGTAPDQNDAGAGGGGHATFSFDVSILPLGKKVVGPMVQHA